MSHLTPESCRRSLEGEPALPGAPGLSAASAPRQGQKPHFLLIATDRLSSTRRARANLRAAPRRRPSPGCAVKGHRVPDCPAPPSSPSKRSHETVLWSVHSRPPETAMSAGPGMPGSRTCRGVTCALTKRCCWQPAGHRDQREPGRGRPPLACRSGAAGPTRGKTMSYLSGFPARCVRSWPDGGCRRDSCLRSHPQGGSGLRGAGSRGSSHYFRPGPQEETKR